MNGEGTFWIDEEEGLLVISDKEGIENKFIIDDQLEIGENNYLILIHEDMIEDEEVEVYVLKLVRDGDVEFLSVIEDDSEFEMVRDEYLAQQ